MAVLIHDEFSNDRRHAVYSGSFDPVTLGHIDIIRRAAELFPRLTVAVGHHPQKKGLFDLDERIAFLRDAVAPFNGVDVMATDALMVDFCRSIQATVIIRGLRSEADFAYEMQMAAVNRELAPEIETVFLLANRDTMFVSSSAVRELASYGHSVDAYVSHMVADALRRLFQS